LAGASGPEDFVAKSQLAYLATELVTWTGRYARINEEDETDGRCADDRRICAFKKSTLAWIREFDVAEFGPHHMLSDEQRVVQNPFSDDLLYALAHYIVSLEPPKNPNLGDQRSSQGKKVFELAGCANCHTPPLYTNNKLTLAQGYRPPKDHPFDADILPASAGTDPNLALKTRKGTGLYKVPSLKGVWYRGLYGHDGSVASLEDWFNPARLRDDYIPTGFKGHQTEHRAVPGHEFGLNLDADDLATKVDGPRARRTNGQPPKIRHGEIELRQSGPARTARRPALSFQLTRAASEVALTVVEPGRARRYRTAPPLPCAKRRRRSSITCPRARGPSTFVALLWDTREVIVNKVVACRERAVGFVLSRPAARSAASAPWRP
jgi:hypothetical protein